MRPTATIAAIAGLAAGVVAAIVTTPSIRLRLIEPGSMPPVDVPTVTGWGETVGSELCTTVVEPSNAPLDAAIATVAMAATTPAAKPTAAANGADRIAVS